MCVPKKMDSMKRATICAVVIGNALDILAENQVEPGGTAHWVLRLLRALSFLDDSAFCTGAPIGTVYPRATICACHIIY